MSRPLRATNSPQGKPAGEAAPAAVPSLFSGSQWQQVLSRDVRADGQFVYAVKSTRIYCRPSCPSRRPSRKSVTFFPNAAAAEQAGYRACKRCEPARTAPREDPHAPLVAAATRYLAEHAGERVRLEDVARATGAGRLTLLRAVRRVLGVTPGEFARAQRLGRFKDALRPGETAAGAALGGDGTALKAPRITDAIYDAGFGSSSRLYESSERSLGMTPGDLRSGGAGLEIRYSTANSPLGRTLVAATDLGICAIAFASDDAELASDLRRRFPKATLVQAESGTGWLAQGVAFVLSHTSENPMAVDFPMDVRATAFQQRVWKALQQIPRGETRSYSEIANELGKPTATRAVAAAIGANPIALAVPCHRVIGRDGSLTGYHWGVERKRKLLEAESAGRPQGEKNAAGVKSATPMPRR